MNRDELIDMAVREAMASGRFCIDSCEYDWGSGVLDCTECQWVARCEVRDLWPSILSRAEENAG
jgi:hypothetical protein